MTAKDYRRLADALLSSRNAAICRDEIRGIDKATMYVADALAHERLVFDRQRFYKAAGYDK